MTGKENRLNFRMTDETAAKIERRYKQDNCRSKNEFIEKAVNFYTDMLSAGDNSIDRKRWAELQEMRLALGHPLDDHEDELNYKYTQPSM